jgi:hypothetical protein
MVQAHKLKCVNDHLLHDQHCLTFLLVFSSGPRAYAPDAPQPVGLLCYPSVFFRRSHFCRQSVSSYVLPERPLTAKGGTAWARIMDDNFA